MRGNAQFVADIAREHGSFGKFLARGRPAISSSVRKPFSIGSLKIRPSTAIGIVPRMMYQPMRASAGAQLPVAHAAHPGRGDPPQVGAEVDEHRGHRAQLDDGGERGTRVVPAEERGDDAQVRGAGDRQELGEPLDDPQDDGLNGVHSALTLVGQRPQARFDPVQLERPEAREQRVPGAVEVSRAGGQQPQLGAAVASSRRTASDASPLRKQGSNGNSDARPLMGAPLLKPARGSAKIQSLR